jgi:hypothetical protein
MIFTAKRLALTAGGGSPGTEKEKGCTGYKPVPSGEPDKVARYARDRSRMAETRRGSVHESPT